MPRAPPGPRARPRTGSDTINRPTAANDSQKPGCSSAQGSSAVTATAATASTSSQGQRQPRLRKPTATASITTVRCAGTPQPASNA